MTLVKISPSFDKIFISKGRIIKGEPFSDEFCRTQAIVEVESSFDSFLSGEFSHHILLVYGDHKEILEKVARILGLDVVQ